MSFEIPEHVQAIRQQVLDFVEIEVYPCEAAREDRGSEESLAVIRGLMQKAKEAGLWALGHPKEIGGQGMPFLDYVYINEVVGRSPLATVALGTHSLQDSIMLQEFASRRGGIVT
jgi:alkylation response protein AidB-like acyl-CoA dehydrogenase